MVIISVSDVLSCRVEGEQTLGMSVVNVHQQHDVLFLQVL